MSFGFPAYHQQKLFSSLTKEEVFLKIKAKALSLKWRLRSETEDALEFKVGLNFWSWGETVKIVFQKSEIFLRSECSIAQCFDWGKNKANCEKIAQALS